MSPINVRLILSAIDSKMSKFVSGKNAERHLFMKKSSTLNETSTA